MANFDITKEPRRALKVSTGVPAIRRATPPPEELPRHTRPQRGRWYMGCLAGMLIITGILFTFSKLVMPFYQRTMDHWTYGDALVYHVRADIGRGAVSDIYTMESQGNVAVIVMTANKTEMYSLKMSIGADTASMLILVSVTDMNGDGKPDLVLHIDGGDISTVLYGNGSGFQPTPPPGR